MFSLETNAGFNWLKRKVGKNKSGSRIFMWFILSLKIFIKIKTSLI
jgi:hypothetical protein